MRSPTRTFCATALIGLLTLGCRPTAGPTAPPAEPHTAFAPIELKVKGDPDWLTAGFGSIWLKHPEGVIDRIDAATAALVTSITVHEARPESCEGIGQSPDGIWSCDEGDLVRIDPTSNDVAATIEAGKIRGQGRLVRAAGQIWVLTGDGDRLVGVSEADGSISEPITLPVACNDLGATADAVYVSCERSDRVLRVDPVNDSVTAEATIDAPTWVSAAASGLWVSAATDLLRLDPVSLATVVTVPGMATGSLGAIWADDIGVWVRRVDPFVSRVDASGSVKRVIGAPYRSGGDILVDGQHLWVTDFDSRLVIRLDLPAAA